MATRIEYRTPQRHAAGQSRAALAFFATAASVLLTGALVASLLFTLFGHPTGQGRLFPPALWFSTGLLFAGGWALARAIYFVRLERQRPFRRWLLTGLVCAALFIGVQSYALTSMLPHDRSAYAASAGVSAFVLALTVMHAMHVIVATLGLSLVTVRTFADRYDHEYYWGVRVCTWFWHALGVVWLAILAVFAIAA